jgi:hypothetical protein
MRGYVSRYPRHMNRVPACPKCGGVARTTKTRFGPRHECCGLWSFNFEPMVDYATHEARRIAKEAFERLAEGFEVVGASGDGLFRAHHAVAEDLGLFLSDAYIRDMDAETAMKVPFAVNRIYGRLLRKARRPKQERSIFD